MGFISYLNQVFKTGTEDLNLQMTLYEVTYIFIRDLISFSKSITQASNLSIFLYEL